MLRLSISAHVSVDEPSPDGGFVTWFDVQVHRYAEVEHDGDHGGSNLEEGGVEKIGHVQIAIVHVGAVFENGEALYDVLDADCGDLEALYDLYFDDDQGWFKDEFACAPGVDLGYIQDVMIEPAWQGRNIEFAVVRRLNETIAAGCKVLVMPVSSPEEAAHWEPMGFEVTASDGSEPSHVHLNNEVRHPRIVPVEHPGCIPGSGEEDRFKVLPDKNGRDEIPEGAESPGTPTPHVTPTTGALPGRTPRALVRRATTPRRPSRRRR